MLPATGPMTDIPSNFTILALEASADQASAALLCDDGRQAQHSHAARHGHAALITELARAALVEAGVTPGGLTHVAAGRGPGSFTGIRVALAAARGFALATGAAGIGVSCLAATAAAALPLAAGRPVLATADTRRGSFFAQAFAPSGGAMSDIIDLDPESAGAVPDGWRDALAVGPGAGPLAGSFAASGLEADSSLPPLDALQIARLAANRLARGLANEPLLPLYVAPAFLGPKQP